jgi:hypothetical protein
MSLGAGATAAHILARTTSTCTFVKRPATSASQRRSRCRPWAPVLTLSGAWRKDDRRHSDLIAQRALIGRNDTRKGQLDLEQHGGSTIDIRTARPGRLANTPHPGDGPQSKCGRGLGVFRIAPLSRSAG